MPRRKVHDRHTLHVLLSRWVQPEAGSTELFSNWINVDIDLSTVADMLEQAGVVLVAAPVSSEPTLTGSPPMPLARN
jgi:hypothetical protein